ncbi:phage tail protein [Sulfuricurvum sp.]|uniref:phage tail protein n=1 Tax=Sulfuricurvum sp. TaxID=2025608 RepID=UPI002637D84D|nr:phage tail protein [Sulfuricurvum sp.]MDD2267006.1 phage tail protein [Sulfuricurvum sp.]MDD2782622.1 phage tail protein [Sulfuricurvum sp.]
MKTMAMIGDFAFSISDKDFNRLSRTVSYGFADIPKAQNYEGSQSIGKDVEEINISGNLITLKSGLKPLSALEAIADKKQAVPFVMGYGDILGDFKITKISEDRSVFLDDGKSIKVDFNIDLKRVRS